MDDERREESNITQSYDEVDALSTLESAESYLAASAASGRASDGCRTPFAASFTAILEWGEATGLICKQEAFSFLGQPPNAFGDEHQAWFDEATNRWFKATYPNAFGLAWGRRGSATAGEYLTRLLLQNQYFGDDIQLVALVNCGEKLRVVTSQPHIVGENALYEEIQRWFNELEFCRFESGGCVAWYRKPDNLLVSDAHEGNVIKTADGTLFAIDLNLIKPDDETRELVISLCNPK
jgi:Serine/Threonine/Tyrosine Kinase found in polyvalent proteins